MPNQWMNYQPTHAPDFSQILTAQAQANELTNKGLQQPMQDALNAQKLQQGALQNSSLQEVLKEKLKQDSDMKLAQDVAAKSIDSKGLLNRLTFLNNAKQAGLDPKNASAYLASFMNDTGLNTKIAANTATATEQRKQANAMQLEGAKALASIATAKARKGNDLTKLIEPMTASMSDGLFDSDQSKAKSALAAALATAQTKQQQAQVADAFRQATNENWLGSKQSLDIDKFNKILAAYQNTIPKNQVVNPLEIIGTYGSSPSDVQYP